MKRIRLSLAALLGACFPAVPCPAGPLSPEEIGTPPVFETPGQYQKRIAWWRDAKFGMFIHWGLYSGLAGNWDGKNAEKPGGKEWLQHHVNASSGEYARQAVPLFKPEEGFAEEWARLAKAAGCRYVVLTTKHHDGFCLFDSKHTTFDAKDLLGRDLVGEFVKAARAEGLRVGFYYSLIDWHHPEYDAVGNFLPYPSAQRTTKPKNHQKYITYYQNQLRELLSNYGRIDILWFDFSAPEFQGDHAWRASETLQEVRGLQPGILVNNRLYRIPEAGYKGAGVGNSVLQLDTRYADFVTPEGHVPAEGVPGVAWETCMTQNGTWGYGEHDTNWRSARWQLHSLLDSVGKGGNLLLNIGPTGDGSVPGPSSQALMEIGKWLERNGEAIYHTRPARFNLGGQARGFVTRKGDSYYVILLERPSSGTITLPIKTKSARFLAGSDAVTHAAGDGTTTITLSGGDLPDPMAAVIKLSE